MKKTRMIGFGISFSILVIAIIGLWAYLAYLQRWYDQIQAELPSIKGKLITLNHETLDQILIPEASKETKREDRDVFTYYHYGVVTHVDYTITDPNLDVQQYYRTLMNQLGWVLRDSYKGEYYSRSKFVDRTTCIGITTYPGNQRTYYIEVYQDFRKQVFSPALPPKWYLSFKGNGEYIIDQCP